MIEKFRIKQFCCCCTTRTGSLVIGVFGWMSSLLQAMTLTSQPETSQIIDQDNTIIVETSSGPNIGSILICIFMFGISVCLVIGVYKDNRKLILPWLIIKCLECCILTIITIVIFFLLFVSETEAVGGLFVIFIIIGLLTAFCWYSFICVWSLYMDMGETTLTYVPTGQSFPMTEKPNQQPQYEQYPNYPMESKPTSPMQEMV